jgi:hypothetical protein
MAGLISRDGRDVAPTHPGPITLIVLDDDFGMWHAYSITAALMHLMQMIRYWEMEKMAAIENHLETFPEADLQRPWHPPAELRVSTTQSYFTSFDAKIR